MIGPNQSLHLTVRTPPNPKPERTLALFEKVDEQTVKTVVEAFVNGTPFAPRDPAFKQNLREEVMKAVVDSNNSVLCVGRMDGKLWVIIDEPKPILTQ